MNLIRYKVKGGRYTGRHKITLGQSLMKKILAVLVLGSMSLSVFAQSEKTLDVKKIISINIEAKFATADQFDNFYIITHENEIIKFDSKGNELFRYSNSRLGDITYFEAANPFHLLVFYQMFNEIVTLDRTLSPSGGFHLTKIELYETNCLSIADNKNLWIYDKDNFQLKKFDFNGTPILASQQLNQIFKTKINPTIVKEVENNVYLFDKAKGIYVFDIFGKFLNFIAVEKVIDFTVLERNIFLFKKKKATNLINSIMMGDDYFYPSELTESGKLFFKNDKIFQVTRDWVSVFKIEK